MSTRPLATYMAERYKDKDYAKQLYSGAFGMVMGKSHELMERGIDPSLNENVLEIGGGGMPHARWMNCAALRSYTISDIIKLHADTLKNLRSELPADVELHLHDFEEDRSLSKVGGGFSRIIASHVLEHIPDPEAAIRHWVSLLADHGVLSIAVPCDPGWLWRLGQKIGYNKDRLGISFAEYDLVMSREHINPVQRIIKIANYYFRQKEVRWFPALVPVADFNFVCVLTLRKSNFIL